MQVFQRLSSLFLLCFLIGSPPCFAATAVDHVEGQTIYFSGSPAPKSLKTELYDLLFVATLASAPSNSTSNDSVPYFLFAADPCPNCSVERALYMIRPTKIPQITSFVYPGRVTDPRSHQLALESRGFYGHCLRGNEEADQYVVFQRENVDRRHRSISSVFIAEASPDYLKERLIEKGLPRIKTTLLLVKEKRCKEIIGRSRTMPVKPRGMSWHNLKQQDDDDDDSDDTDSPAPGAQ